MTDPEVFAQARATILGEIEDPSVRELAAGVLSSVEGRFVEPNAATKDLLEVVKEVSLVLVDFIQEARRLQREGGFSDTFERLCKLIVYHGEIKPSTTWAEMKMDLVDLGVAVGVAFSISINLAIGSPWRQTRTVEDAVRFIDEALAQLRGY